MNKCKLCYVSGLVQGVFFRASTQAKADELGVVGYARNLPDRRVEVLACGPEASVEALQEWLWQGPRHAQVTDVRCSCIETAPDLESFNVE